jgi:hypothetical protein
MKNDLASGLRALRVGLEGAIDETMAEWTDKLV